MHMYLKYLHRLARQFKIQFCKGHKYYNNLMINSLLKFEKYIYYIQIKKNIKEILL